jgi:hypothetical protein
MSTNLMARIDEIVEGDRQFLETLRQVACLYGNNEGDFSEIEAFVRFVFKASKERAPDLDPIDVDEDAEAESGLGEYEEMSGRQRAGSGRSFTPFD